MNLVRLARSSCIHNTLDPDGAAQMAESANRERVIGAVCLAVRPPRAYFISCWVRGNAVILRWHRAAPDSQARPWAVWCVPLGPRSHYRGRGIS
jgi:hypothetical protein